MSVANNHSLTADHRRHDRLLVARYAAGDALDSQQREAQELIRWCGECAALAADIGQISRAVGQLPATRRPRDFRLTAEQAAQLRGSRLEHWLRTLTGSGWATVRPVAAVALSIGLVMSVLGTLPIIGAAVPSAPTFAALEVDAGLGQNTGRSNDAPSAESPPSVMAGGPGPTADALTKPADGIDNVYVQPSAVPLPEAGKAGTHDEIAPTGLSARDVLFLAGLAVSVLALVVLSLLYAARRRFTDPLLR